MIKCSKILKFNFVLSQFFRFFKLIFRRFEKKNDEFEFIIVDNFVIRSF